MILSVLQSPPLFPWIAIAGMVLFLVATVLSHAGRISRSLRPFVGRPVRVAVWGSPLAGSDVLTFEVDSIMAFGAGLLIHLRQDSGGPRILLKVAQPASPLVAEGRAEIGFARYVSWHGAKLKQADGQPAVLITLAS